MADLAPPGSKRVSEVWENQRKASTRGLFEKCRLSEGIPPFSTKDGLAELNMTALEPQFGWRWASEWELDTRSNNCDADGWSYSTDLSSEFVPQAFAGSFMRRRRWVREQVKLGDSVSVEADDLSTPSITRAELLEDDQVFSPSGFSAENRSFSVSFKPDMRKISDLPHLGIYLVENTGQMYQACGYDLEKLDWEQENIPSRFRQVVGDSTCLWGLTHRSLIFSRSLQDADGVHFVTHTCYENQRWRLSKSWVEPYLPGDRKPWTDITGEHESKKTSFYLPSSRWYWVNEWTVSVTNNTDEEGWEYAFNFPNTYSKNCGISDGVRRRKWTRTRRLHDLKRLVWTEVLDRDASSPDLRNPVSLAYSPGNGSCWALTKEFTLYMRCRTPQEFEGLHWTHIHTPKVGADYISPGLIALNRAGLVFLLSTDGKLYLRSEATKKFPHGESWILLSSPLLKYFCVSTDSAWGIDLEGNVLVRTTLARKDFDKTPWTAIQPPPDFSDTFSKLFVSDTTLENSLVCAITSRGRCFYRRITEQENPQKDIWSLLNYPKEIAFMSITTPKLFLLRDTAEDTIDLASHFLALVSERDELQTANPAFQTYLPFYDPSPSIASEKTGTLDVFINDRWQAVSVELSSRSSKVSVLESSTLKPLFEIPLTNIQSVRNTAPNEGQSKFHCFVIEYESLPKSHELLCCASGGKAAKEWVLSISFVLQRKAKHGKTRAHPIEGHRLSRQVLWAIDEFGDCWLAEPDFQYLEILAWYPPPSLTLHSSWGKVPGFASCVATGPNGHVWVISKKGQIFALHRIDSPSTLESDAPSEYHRSRLFSSGSNDLGLASESQSVSLEWVLVPFPTYGSPISFVSIALTQCYVWAVSSSGQLYVRSDLTEANPAGTKWHLIKSSHRFLKVHVSPSHEVWALTSTGSLLLRDGFSLDFPFGLYWRLKSSIVAVDGGSTVSLPSSVAFDSSGSEPFGVLQSIAGCNENLFALNTKGELVRGKFIDRELKSSFVDRSNIRQLASTWCGKMWAVSDQAELLVWNDRMLTSLAHWDSIVSVSAINPNQGIKIQSLAACALDAPIETVDPGVHTWLANGVVVRRAADDPWASSFLPLIRERDARMHHIKSSKGGKYLLLSNPKGLRTNVFATRGNGDWSSGVIEAEGPSSPSGECLVYLVRLTDGSALWALKSELVLGEIPDPSSLFEGAKVLFRDASVSDSRFFPATILEFEREANRYRVEVMEDGRVQTCIGAQLRVFWISE